MGERARMGRRRVAVLAALAAMVPALSACGLTEDEPDLVAGKQLFVEKCGSCHVLNRAGTKGVTGPNLDQAFQQPLKEGFGESAVRGVISKQIEYPARFAGDKRPDGSAAMPSADDLGLSGEQTEDIAAYVAQVVGKSGEDSGLLATAVKKAGSDEPIEAQDGKLVIPADPGGQLLYTSSQAIAPPGAITIESPNESSVPHNIVIDEFGVGEIVQDGGVSVIEGTLEAGQEYAYYCSVEGHREAGMEGTLTVQE